MLDLLWRFIRWFVQRPPEDDPWADRPREIDPLLEARVRLKLGTGWFTRQRSQMNRTAIIDTLTDEEYRYACERGWI